MSKFEKLLQYEVYAKNIEDASRMLKAMYYILEAEKRSITWEARSAEEYSAMFAWDKASEEQQRTFTFCYGRGKKAVVSQSLGRSRNGTHITVDEFLSITHPLNISDIYKEF